MFWMQKWILVERMVPPVIKVGKLGDECDIAKSSVPVVNSLHKKEQEVNLARYMLIWDCATYYIPDFSSL